MTKTSEQNTARNARAGSRAAIRGRIEKVQARQRRVDQREISREKQADAAEAAAWAAAVKEANAVKAEQGHGFGSDSSSSGFRGPQQQQLHLANVALADHHRRRQDLHRRTRDHLSRMQAHQRDVEDLRQRMHERYLASLVRA
jgi:hypothetical protein